MKNVLRDMKRKKKTNQGAKQTIKRKKRNT